VQNNSKRKTAYGIRSKARNLGHRSGLSVSVSVLGGVEAVHERWLSVLVLDALASGGGSRVASLDAVTVTSLDLAEVARAAAAALVVVFTVLVVLALGGNATDRAGLTLEAVIALLASAQDTALLLKVGHADSGKGRCGVVLGCVVVNLVDGDSGVDNVLLDGLLLNNGLDGLVDVVVDVLASKGRSDGVGVASGTLDALISELSGLGLQAVSNLAVVAVLELAVLNGTKVVVVLLREDLAVLDRLDGGVVVVLVNLLVDGGGDLLVLGRSDGLVENSGCNALVDGGVVVTSLGPVEIVSGLKLVTLFRCSKLFVTARTIQPDAMTTSKGELR